MNIDILPNVIVYSNTRLINRVFQNLIQNAISHGQTEFYLQIIKDKDIKIIFKNQIADVNDIELDKVFNRFYTSSKARTGKSSGIGLAIVKEIVKQLGGEISAGIKNNEFEVVLVMSKSD